MGIRLKQGRLFADSDNRQAVPVVVIGERMARRFWAGRNPIGQRVAFDQTDGRPNWREVVGIVADIRAESLAAEPYAQLYVPDAQLPQRGMTLLIRGAGDPAKILPDVRATVYSVDREQPLHGIRTMEEVLSASTAQPRQSMILLGTFAMLAVVLAGIGVSGVMAHTVSQRTQEMGVRMALGAREFDVLKTVIGHGMMLALTGIAAGLAVALGLSRLIAGMLFGTEPYDPATFLLITTALAAVSLLACYIPARRATRVDPVIALRCE